MDQLTQVPRTDAASDCINTMRTQLSSLISGMRAGRAQRKEQHQNLRGRSTGRWGGAGGVVLGLDGLWIN